MPSVGADLLVVWPHPPRLEVCLGHIGPFLDICCGIGQDLRRQNHLGQSSPGCGSAKLKGAGSSLAACLAGAVEAEHSHVRLAAWPVRALQSARALPVGALQPEVSEVNYRLQELSQLP